MGIKKQLRELRHRVEREALFTSSIAVDCSGLALRVLALEEALETPPSTAGAPASPTPFWECPVCLDIARPWTPLMTWDEYLEECRADQSYHDRKHRDHLSQPPASG